MNRQSVSSSNIRSIGYDSAQQLLEVEFNDGGLYQYHGVPQPVYQGLIGASSHGRYFHVYVREKYPTTRIR